MSFRLDPGEAIAAGLRRSAHEQLEHALGEFGEAARDRHTAIHEARKSCKRLRGLLRLARSGLGDEQDLAVLEATLAAEAESARLVAELSTRRHAALRADMGPLGQRLFAERPGTLARRFEADWQASQSRAADGGELRVA